MKTVCIRSTSACRRSVRQGQRRGLIRDGKSSAAMPICFTPAAIRRRGILQGRGPGPAPYSSPDANPLFGRPAALVSAHVHHTAAAHGGPPWSARRARSSRRPYASWSSRLAGNQRQRYSAACSSGAIRGRTSGFACRRRARNRDRAGRRDGWSRCFRRYAGEPGAALIRAS